MRDRSSDENDLVKDINVDSYLRNTTTTTNHHNRYHHHHHQPEELSTIMMTSSHFLRQEPEKTMVMMMMASNGAVDSQTRNFVGSALGPEASYAINNKSGGLKSANVMIFFFLIKSSIKTKILILIRENISKLEKY